MLEPPPPSGAVLQDYLELQTAKWLCVASVPAKPHFDLKTRKNFFIISVGRKRLNEIHKFSSKVGREGKA